jgi:hypothetical protein
MEGEHDDLTRIYFDVLDDAGRKLPAVQYWAASCDQDQPAFKEVPVYRFIKLLLPREPLEEIDDAYLKGLRTGKLYRRTSASSRGATQ